jgi:glucosamine kinase
MVAEAIPGEIDVVGDMRIALQAAFGPGPGVIVISGTGSIAFGRDAQGQTARAGGWGFAISDEGSAHWIGRTAVAAVLRAADRLAEDPIAGQTSALFREISAAWEVGSCEELAMRANKLPNFAELLRGVVAAADASDDLAQEVLRNAGKELAQLAEIVLGRLFPEGGLQTHVAFAGGVFRHASLAREVFCRAVQATHPNVILNYEVVEPVHGALQLARNSER